MEDVYNVWLKNKTSMISGLDAITGLHRDDESISRILWCRDLNITGFLYQYCFQGSNNQHRPTFDIRRTLVGNRIIDHSDVIFILNLTPGFDGLGKDNCKARREIFKFWHLVDVY